MFNGASSFTSDLAQWDVAKVTYMGVRDRATACAVCLALHQAGVHE